MTISPAIEVLCVDWNHRLYWMRNTTKVCAICHPPLPNRPVLSLLPLAVSFRFPSPYRPGGEWWNYKNNGRKYLATDKMFKEKKVTQSAIEAAIMEENDEENHGIAESQP